MRHPYRLLVATVLLLSAGVATAKADANSMLLVTCEPGVPYFSIETVIVETDGDIGASVGGNGLLQLRSMIDRPIECVVGKYKVRASLTEFYPSNERRALQAANIAITINGSLAAELHATHRNEADGRARVEVNAYAMTHCESTSNDWATEKFPPDRKDQMRRSLLCITSFLSGRW